MSENPDLSLINKNMNNALLDPASLSVDETLTLVNKNLKKRGINSSFPKIILVVFSTFLILALSLYYYHLQFKVEYLETMSVYDEIQFENFEITNYAPFEMQISETNTEEIDALSILAFNPVNYQTFIEQNADEKRSIASITKLMTASVMVDSFDDQYVFTMFEDFPEDPGENSLGLKIGDKLAFDDAMDSLLVSSHNDTAMLIAQNYPGGYEMFVVAMNDRAESLGMYNTSFSNPIGYDNVNNYSSANDLKKLAIHTIKNPTIIETVAKIDSEIEITNKDGEVKKVKIKSTNELLKVNPQIKGLKTGYTSESGQCFIGYVNASEDNQLVTIILGSNENRFDETEELMKLLNENFTPILIERPPLQ